jgi:gluconolactonase
MERKEPYATQEEFSKRVIRYRDIPLVELVPGSKSHIVSTERMTVSFLTMAPDSHFAIHRHEQEQIMIVIDGACDEIIEGKLYHLEKGDVAILPANTEHGGYISDKSCRVIDVFSPPRRDLVAKLEVVKKGTLT